MVLAYRNGPTQRRPQKVLRLDRRVVSHAENSEFSFIHSFPQGLWRSFPEIHMVIPFCPTGSPY